MARRENLALKRTVFIVCASAVFIALALVIFIARPNRDERMVRKHLHALARQCEKKPNRGMFRSLADLSDLRASFTSNAVISLGRPYPVQPSPGELASLVARAHREVDSLEIIIQGIEFLPRTDPEIIDLLTAVTLRFRREEQTEEIMEEYRLRWRKENGRWRIESARAESTIQPPW